MIHIYIISDLHLEERKSIPDDIFPTDPIQPNSICILNGDISEPDLDSYTQFLQEAKSKFDHVIVCIGNHECYYSSLWYADTKCRQICEELGCIFLEKESVVIDGVKFIGTTLWSNITPEVYAMLNKKCLKGYHSIEEFSDENFDYSSVLFEENLNYIQAELAISDLPCVVITHHAPTRLMNNSQRGRCMKMEAVYCNDLDDMFSAPIVLWVSGHTHVARILEINNVLLVSNPYGRKKEKTGYDRNLYISL